MKKILKNIYWALPYKRILFNIIKKFYSPNKEIYKHLRFKEPFSTKIDEFSEFKIFNSTIIENEIFWNGFAKTWEKTSLRIWVKLAKKYKYIIDIGANTGIYSLSAAAVNSKAKIHAFEPLEIYFNILENNLKMNNFEKNIIPSQLAVGNKNSIIEIDDYSGYEKKIQVKSTTIDKYIKVNKIPKIELIKIDVEHYEPYVFEGMKETIIKFKPTILVEVLTDECANKISSFVKDLDYHFFNIDEEKGISKVDKICKSYYWNFLICRPNVSKYLGFE